MDDQNGRVKMALQFGSRARDRLADVRVEMLVSRSFLVAHTLMISFTIVLTYRYHLIYHAIIL